MTRASSRLALPAMLALAVAFGPSARAGIITQFEPLDTSFGEILRFDRFDPALGELEEVRVNLLGGLLMINGSTAPRFGPFGTPIPYGYDVESTLDAISVGLGGFEFDSPMRFLFPGRIALGIGESFTIIRPFSFDFSFTEFSDLAGFTFLTGSGFTVPPTAVTGTREDFVETEFFAGFETLFLPLPTTTTSSAVTVTGTRFTGLVQIDYLFDEAPVDPGPGPGPGPEPTGVPGPATLLLASLGLAMVAAARRRTVAV